jgi:hypothetical protein
LDLGSVGGQLAHTFGRRGNKSVPPAADALVVHWMTARGKTAVQND